MARISLNRFTCYTATSWGGGKSKFKIENIFEIGLGSNYQDVVSHMDKVAVPGASLRGFRDYCESAKVWGGDIDERILFQEDRIQTFLIDQTSIQDVDALLDSLKIKFDLIIDDGLHSIDANIATLIVGTKYLNNGGWIVIEDIGENTLIFWRLITKLLKDKYTIHIFNSESNGYIFALHKLIK